MAAAWLLGCTPPPASVLPTSYHPTLLPTALAAACAQVVQEGVQAQLAPSRALSGVFSLSEMASQLEAAQTVQVATRASSPMSAR